MDFSEFINSITWIQWFGHATTLVVGALIYRLGYVQGRATGLKLFLASHTIGGIIIDGTEETDTRDRAN